MSRDLIRNEISALLRLRRTPGHLRDDGLRDAFIDQVADVVLPYAPDSDVVTWIKAVCEKAIVGTKGSGYPDVSTWAKAVGAATFQSIEPASAQDLPWGERIFRINCERLSRNEHVDENFLFGREVDRALSEGRITLRDLNRRRLGCFWSRVPVWGREKALEWLQQMDERCGTNLMADARRALDKARHVRAQHAADDDQEVFE